MLVSVVIAIAAIIALLLAIAAFEVLYDVIAYRAVRAKAGGQ